MLINGNEYGWAQAVTTVAGIVVEGITEINYSDKRAKKDNYGAGSKPVSRSYGAYEASGDVTLHMSEVERLTNVAPGRDLTQLGMFDITVTFAPQLGMSPVKHVLRGCEFTDNMRAMKQGDDKFDVKLTLIVAEIAW
ncbi:hypothetical protein E4631_24050 [Hymenobacter sp. UV11]|uniref:hypothetical protein n=1 Tax=Hymenobacter sp. UV11 TaxID=1849735 RepID=UPI0010622014|nr:hypothetical protein [Hymenobacter sp. UV11]TDN38608.1 hypothetical protein A8B98_22955 [Hymenobacter sp. UV11]TFZ63004.1 hypothetical protein E4631_24050 [Hymenobacter sp. UV11]